MICDCCGVELTTGASFCSSCGQRQGTLFVQRKATPLPRTRHRDTFQMLKERRLAESESENEMREASARFDRNLDVAKKWVGVTLVGVPCSGFLALCMGMAIFTVGSCLIGPILAGVLAVGVGLLFFATMLVQASD